MAQHTPHHPLTVRCSRPRALFPDLQTNCPRLPLMHHSEPDPAGADMHARSLQARLAAGEEAAFAELYDTHGAQLFRIATAIVGAGRQADAEDALQDVFTGLVRVRRSLARVDNLAGYLVASVRRAAIRRRRQPRLAALPDAD
ncbi:MAG: RNA polymerase sigma factor, partial [Planctomycetota bacterium]